MSTRGSVLRGWLLTLTGLLLSSVPAYAATDAGTLQVGRLGGNCGGGGLEIASGFFSTYGSYSPTGLTGGQTVVDVHDFTGVCPGSSQQFGTLWVSGFSSNPGATWLTSVTCNGASKSGAAATFIYNSGTAYWYWHGSQFGLNSLAIGASVSCSIVHN